MLSTIRLVKHICNRGNASKKERDLELDEEERQRRLKSSEQFVEHSRSAEQLAAMFPESRIDVAHLNGSKGLSDVDAQKKLMQDGPNRLTPPKEISNILLFLRQFLNVFVLMLIVSGVLGLVTYFTDVTIMVNLYLALALFIVVLLMGIVQFWQEKKSLNVIRGFANLLPQHTVVIRDGKEIDISAEVLVVGDLVWIRNGSKVPADVRMLSCNGLKLETSAITGESEPIDYTPEAASPDSSVFDSHNVAFNGSMCVDGEGMGIVVRVANSTVIGQIAALSNNQNERKTMLHMEVRRFVMFVCILSVVMAVIVFIIGCILSHGQRIGQVFVSGFLVVMLANVPQGLPATVTSQLTIIARRMAKKHVYIKKLAVVDSFGAATVIATDKTGTLTKNDMTVTDLWYNGTFSSGLPDIKQRTLLARQGMTVGSVLEMFEKPLPELLTVMAVCNKTSVTREVIDANQLTLSKQQAMNMQAMNMQSFEKQMPARQFSVTRGERLKITGNPSETALTRFCEKIFSVNELRQIYQVVFEIPFNSLRKYHLIICKTQRQDNAGGDTEFVVMMKGAPEMLLPKCTQYMSANGMMEVDNEFRMEFEDAYSHFGNEGRRVIGFSQARFNAPANTAFSVDAENFPLNEMCFVGMAAIMDPPRDDTASAIRACKSAGIKIFMVTGDHPATASAIARQIGLLGPIEQVERRGRFVVSISVEAPDFVGNVIHGSRINELTQSDWDELVRQEALVFARTTPEQKLRIVEECQKRGEVVAVTGDGVNDAPALKRADIGVAMGMCGSDVAKQAADIVLMDDRFASIVSGIEEGRLLFDNLKKTIAYTLTHWSPEIFSVILNLMVGLPMPLSPLLVLSVDLGTELAPAISLAYENAEKDIMQKPPRARGKHLVTKALLSYSYLIAGSFVTIACIFAYFYTFWHYGIQPSDLPFTAEKYWGPHTVDPFCIRQPFHNDFSSNATVEQVFANANRTINNFGADGSGQDDDSIRDYNSTSPYPVFCFTPDEQRRIAHEASAAWYLTLIMSQVYHVWMCTTRRVSLFQQGITNLVIIFAVIIELCLLILFVFVPGLNDIMEASPPPGHAWLPSLACGLVLWLFNESRKWYNRTYPHTTLARMLHW